MPKIISHDERRAAVARAAREIMLTNGFDRLTIRDLAKKLGFSTTVVSHYFANKNELMLLVFGDSQKRSEARFRAAIDCQSSLSDALQTLLPLNEESREDWRVWFTFWSMCISNEEFRAEQQLHARNTVKKITKLLKRESDDKTTGAALKLKAQSLFAQVTGIATQAIHDPTNWPAKRQKQLLDLAVSNLD